MRAHSTSSSTRAGQGRGMRSSTSATARLGRLSPVATALLSRRLPRRRNFSARPSRRAAPR
eukprot:CAMPEP_0206007814 /NCGR_PEP_ID=MMETSP1464-20131121/6230_1 /ASSEMBLY_ACC=CAM_ASM_001124 /TAXON_ID=119497 /ORGANISM="Exanthemachrysis gayraliae, Strain RCC1523" /LENGTH=60 /DNA_ID=CAMNT_0053381319 /DNA_START=63 /DNA_END=242 /DNA_ORIENTATION=+